MFFEDFLTVDHLNLHKSNKNDLDFEPTVAVLCCVNPFLQYSF